MTKEIPVLLKENIIILLYFSQRERERERERERYQFIE